MASSISNAACLPICVPIRSSGKVLQCTATSVHAIANHSGLRAVQSGRGWNGQKQDLTTSFHDQVRQTVCARGRGRTACRAQVTMMPIGTPKVPYRTPQEGGWQWVDIWNVLYRERIIFIGQYIDEEFGNQILATMLYLDSVDNTKPLYLYLNSPGGDITPTMAIYDTMESIKSPVGTLALGYAYNNAGFLLGAGSKVHRPPADFYKAVSRLRWLSMNSIFYICMNPGTQSQQETRGTFNGWCLCSWACCLGMMVQGLRVAMPLTRIALQSPAGAARGQADDIQNEAKELARVRAYVYSQVAKKTGQSVEKVTKDLNRIKRFSSQEALDYGLIDRIIRPRRIKPDARKQETAGVGLG